MKTKKSKLKNDAFVIFPTCSRDAGCEPPTFCSSRLPRMGDNGEAATELPIPLLFADAPPPMSDKLLRDPVMLLPLLLPLLSARERFPTEFECCIKRCRSKGFRLVVITSA